MSEVADKNIRVTKKKLKHAREEINIFRPGLAERRCCKQSKARVKTKILWGFPNPNLDPNPAQTHIAERGFKTESVKEHVRGEGVHHYITAVQCLTRKTTHTMGGEENTQRKQRLWENIIIEMFPETTSLDVRPRRCVILSLFHTGFTGI